MVVSTILIAVLWRTIDLPRLLWLSDEYLGNRALYSQVRIELDPIATYYQLLIGPRGNNAVR